MRSTLCYTVMTLSLTSVLGYTAYSAMQPIDGAPQSLAVNDAAPVMIRPHTSAVMTDRVSVATISPPTIQPGDSREGVFATFGSPDRVEADQNRWTYGSRVVLFKDDAVVGTMMADPLAVARDRLAQAKLSEDDKSPAKQAPRKMVRTAYRSGIYAKSASRMSSAGHSSLAINYLGQQSLFASDAFQKPQWLRGWSEYRSTQRQAANSRNRSGAFYGAAMTSGGSHIVSRRSR